MFSYTPASGAAKHLSEVAALCGSYARVGMKSIWSAAGRPPSFSSAARRTQLKTTGPKHTIHRRILQLIIHRFSSETWKARLINRYTGRRVWNPSIAEDGAPESAIVRRKWRKQVSLYCRKERLAMVLDAFRTPETLYRTLTSCIVFHLMADIPAGKRKIDAVQRPCQFLLRCVHARELQVPRRLGFGSCNRRRGSKSALGYGGWNAPGHLQLSRYWYLCYRCLA